MSFPAPSRHALPPKFPIIWQDDVRYDLARIGRVFNHRRPSRYPIAVVQPTNQDHVVEAVLLATKLGCRISIRSGGHSWAAWSVRDDAILVDFGKFNYFHVDDATGVASVSPNMTGRVINQLLEPHGRWFPGGHCPDVAVGGFLLQGGMGWNCKNWGWACEKIVAIDVVTAEGRKLRCDENQNTDLFWAARGAGPGFPAIVTRFHLQTLPRYSHVRDSTFVYGKENYRAALNWVIKLSPTFDADTEIAAIGSYVPGLEGVQTIVRFTTFKNSQEEAETALEPAHASAPPGANITALCTETSLSDQYDLQHAANPEGHRYRVDNCYIRNDADVASVMENAFVDLPTKKSFSLWYSMAPCSRKDRDGGSVQNMALSMQSDHYFAVYAVCESPTGDKDCADWVRGIMVPASKQSPGAYLGDADFQERVSMYWNNENAQNLIHVISKWDPRGLIAGYLNKGDTGSVEGLRGMVKSSWSSNLA
ncbi:unnamed protein product [Clonostachys solani]|uniref:FAD-binding PCMH-type domain-containing protein n=1 Tax=Clonostachys solani TaxID=160281 RepID=A0A9P0EJD8_9HYPO|nr:unnamed protein product [Clonostachys solani]